MPARVAPIVSLAFRSLPVRRVIAPMARVRWRAVVFTFGFLGLVVVLGLWSLAASDDPSNFTGDEQLGSFTQFLLAVYRTQNFQVFAGMLLVGAVLEAVVPACTQRSGTWRFNIPYGGMMLLFDSVVAPLPIFIADVCTDRFGWRPIFNLSFGTNGTLASSCAAVLISVLCADFFQYWFHRLQHGRLLWPQHAVHHSDAALNVATTQRAHVIDHLLLPIAMTVPMALFFDLPANNIIILALLPSLWPYVIHMNLRVGFGRCWWLLTSPQYHRIHHSCRPEHRDRNFALWMPLWDVLFGTAYRPQPGEYPTTGVPGLELDDLAAAFLHPFRCWYMTLVRSLRSAGPGRSSNRLP